MSKLDAECRIITLMNRAKKEQAEKEHEWELRVLYR